VLIANRLGCSKGSGVIRMVGQEILDSNKAVTVDTENVGSIVCHHIAPLTG